MTTKRTKPVKTKLLGTMGAFVETKKGVMVLHVPIDLEKQAKAEYNFSFDMLKIGGDISLPELAEHMDNQATLEARFGYLAEMARYQKEVAVQEFEIWYAKKYRRAKEYLTIGTKTPTEKAVEAYIIEKYEKTYRRLKEEVGKAEFQYRLLYNAIHAAIETKGKMLQSLRNVLMGTGFTGLNVQMEDPRSQLKV